MTEAPEKYLPGCSEQSFQVMKPQQPVPETKGDDQCLQLKSPLFRAIHTQQPLHFGHRSVLHEMLSPGFVLCPVHSLQAGNKSHPSQPIV